MHHTGPFRVNAPQVISENIEGELVMINLVQGSYFSTEGSGAAIWGLVEQGLAAEDVVAGACAAFAAEPSEVKEAVTGFLERLLEEGLIVPAEEGAEPQASRQPEPSGDGTPFKPPVLNVYTDMADILLLDPVHDVDEQGWPQPKLTTEQS